MDREGGGQLLELDDVVGLGILHRYVELADLLEDVLPGDVGAGRGGWRRESRHVLGQCEAHLAARNDVHGQVVYGQTSGDDCQARVCRIAVVEFVVVVVEEREPHDLVVAGQEFDLAAADSVFGILRIGR